MSLEGKVSIVTGGSGGIGRAITKMLAEKGSDVILADRNCDTAEPFAQELEAATRRRVIPIQTDIAYLDSAKHLIEQTLETFGRIDILVNNAGITRDNLIMRMEEADFDDVIQVNLKGAWNCCKAVIRPMMRQKYGRIVNISSVSGLAGQTGQTNYSASKAGLIGMTKALAREVASRGITVNAVAPGFIPTALTNDLPPDLKEAILKATPMGRMGKPEEIAYAVAFFAAEEAAYVTGQVLSVDGGMVMM